MKKVRIEIRAKNNRLYKLAEQYGGILGLTRAMNIRTCNANEICSLMNLKKSPLKRGPHGKILGYKRMCERLADFARMLPEELFPIDLYNDSINPGFIEVGLEEIEDRTAYLLEDKVQEHIVADQIEKVLNTLSSKEANILRYRYGLGGVPKHTLVESAHIYGITKERIRQIEDRAMERIRERFPELQQLLIT